MSDIWQKLHDHRSATQEQTLLSLFDSDPARFDRFSQSADGLMMDYSKTALDETALALLVDLAEASDLPARISAMMSGARINTTENRAVLHTALRAPRDSEITLDGENVMPAIHAVLARMAQFSTELRDGSYRGASGAAISDVVNIGIGGSDLGPVMATLALAPYHDGPRCHFVSNVDGAHVHDVLKGLDPASTLVVIASKTFTTIETMTNAATAIKWLRAGLGQEDVSAHLAAVSTADDKTAAMGIPPSRVFGFADWVGGRYSMWGPIGLPIMIAIGAEAFGAFLEGAHAMDRHFATAPIAQNLPALLGLIGVWHNNICGYGARAVLPYDQRLARLPAYLQQLDMESNGKSVGLDGTALHRASGPVVWGEPGTNGQHAFYQLLHQGTQVVPAEFLIARSGHEADLAHQHRLLMANCLAQSEALMRGRSRTEALALAKARGFEGDAAAIMAGHLSFPGNRPSITLAYERLTPFTLGQIVALYEHRVFTEGVIWGINSFDQWGVELGKELALSLQPILEGHESAAAKDGSTRGLLAYLGG